jgi:hypothetical protein
MLICEAVKMCWEGKAHIVLAVFFILDFFLKKKSYLDSEKKYFYFWTFFGAMASRS